MRMKRLQCVSGMRESVSSGIYIVVYIYMGLGVVMT